MSKCKQCESGNHSSHDWKLGGICIGCSCGFVARRPNAPSPPAEPKCAECRTCLEGVMLEGTDIPVTVSRMILCSECGNKRCPKATDHRLDCTNDNSPGQPGSWYAEPDATERARAFFVKQGKWDLAERFDGWQCCELMTAFLESERPRIKADAVREFIAEVEKEIIEPSGDDLFDGHQLLTTGSVLRVMRSIQARQVAKEMTEEAK